MKTLNELQEAIHKSIKVCFCLYNNKIGKTEAFRWNESYLDNGLTALAYVPNEKDGYDIYDAYLMVGKEESYVDLCKWYNTDGKECPRNDADAECVVIEHCSVIGFEY